MDTEKTWIPDERLSEVVGGAGDSGRFVWPVPGFYCISSHFMDPDNPHGIVIAGAGIEGAQVMAAETGTVNSLWYSTGGWGGGYGTYCMIDHPDGRSTLYAHLAQLVVSPGEQVFRGQMIGSVGRSGDTTAPGLYFETRRSGVPYDPMSEY